MPLKNVHAIDQQSKCKTFRDVMKILESNSEMAARKVVDGGGAVQPLHALINPVIGPEAVTGSSRMKGQRYHGDLRHSLP